MAARIPKLEPIGATCNVCQRTTVDLGDHNVTAESPGEHWDAFEPLLAERGWMVRVNPITGEGREAVCPACIRELEHRRVMPLPPFVADARCPKCGGVDVSAQFCVGRVSNCTLGVERDHMHRDCKTCGFGWTTACADARRGWLSRLFLALWPGRRNLASCQNES